MRVVVRIGRSLDCWLALPPSGRVSRLISEKVDLGKVKTISAEDADRLASLWTRAALA
jgi:hypothetical protein